MSISGSTLQGASSVQQSSATESSSPDATKEMQMGRQEFLKLLLTQMKNQDPLNPMKGQEFATHLAQFSSVEQLMNINKTLTDREDTTQQLAKSLNNSTAAGLIGKTVRATGDTVQFSGQTDLDIPFTLDQQAEKVTVKITDETGKTVRTLEQNNVSSGDQTVSWDGRDDDGNQLPDGTYQISVEASDSSGDSVNATTYLQGPVERVRFGEDSIELMVNGRTIALDQVKSVGS